MSQSYRIRIPESVVSGEVTSRSREVVCVDDSQSKSLVLTEIVPSEEQKEILKGVLESKGWEDAGGGKMVRRRAGVTETFDLEAMTVEATAELERTLERERSRKVVASEDDFHAARAEAQEELDAEVAISDSERERARETIRKEALRALEATEDERVKELNEVAREVYAEALKRKAGRLGTITEIAESQDGEDYEMIIKITE